MKRIVPIPIAVCSILLSSTLAQGGVNEGGVLIFHGAPELIYTEGIDACAAFDLPRCADALTEMPPSESPQIWFAVAAFPETGSPRLSAIEFGIYWNESELVLTNYGPCGDRPFELSTSDWPSPGEGTAIAWPAARTGLTTPVYWFAGYSYSGGPGTFDVIPHPIHGGHFADDSYPSELDEIAAYGALGFGGVSGSLPCPDVGESGACCLTECECVVLGEAACFELGGVWTVGADCSLGLCGCAPSACCLPDGACEVLSPTDCDLLGGEFFAELHCDPAPCVAGACCLEDGSCLETTEQGCAAAEGSFSAGLSCAEVECQEPCDPVLVPRKETQARGGNPNDGGVLIVHADPAIVYTDGVFDYCGLASLETCEDANVRVDPEESVIFSVFAAFPPGNSPEFTFVDFGVYFPTCMSILDAGGCGDVSMVTNWPDSPAGLSVGWFEVQTNPLTEVAWISVSIGSGLSGEFALGPHPQYGGRFGIEFGSDSEIADYGRLGFRTDGYLPCPAPETAACCYPDGSCQVLTGPECEGSGGLFQVESSDCEPNPCLPVPTIETSWGRVKDRFRSH